MGRAFADDGAAYIDMGKVLDGREDGFEALPYDGAGHGVEVKGAAGGAFRGDAGDAGGFAVEVVEAELVGDEEADEDAAGEADGEAEDIDKGKGFFPEEMADRRVLCNS